jgi:cytochrome c
VLQAKGGPVYCGHRIKGRDGHPWNVARRPLGRAVNAHKDSRRQTVKAGEIMSGSSQLNTIAMGVLSAALFAFGGKTLIEVMSKEHHAAKPGYVLPVAKVAAIGGAAAPAGFSFAKIAELLPKVSADAGEEGFKKCAACHTNTKGGDNKVGPNLWNVVGRPVGQSAGFAYSEAVKAKGGNWSWETLAAYLNDPRGNIPGNKMAFAGLTDPTDLAEMLAYLRKLGDKPVDFPSK